MKLKEFGPPGGGGARVPRAPLRFAIERFVISRILGIWDHIELVETFPSKKSQIQESKLNDFLIFSLLKWSTLLEYFFEQFLNIEFLDHIKFSNISESVFTES